MRGKDLDKEPTQKKIKNRKTEKTQGRKNIGEKKSETEK